MKCFDLLPIFFNINYFCNRKKESIMKKDTTVYRFSTSLVWYHRSAKMPEIGQRIIVLSPMYEKSDPLRIRVIDSQFYRLSADVEWWAYINTPE